MIFADSRNRDVQIYPSGNSYVLHLTTPIKNISRVDLVSARVPNTMYNLTNGSNVFSINSSNISVNSGFYSVYGLAQAVTSNAVVTLDYLPDEGHFVFSGASSFTLTIFSSEFANLSGFQTGTTYTSVLATALDPDYSGKHVIKSKTLVNMAMNDYVFLDIDELRTPWHVDAKSLVSSTGTVSGSNSNRSFAPIMLDVGSACIKNFHESKDYKISVNYPEPIGTLSRLTIRWYDKDGALLNFRGWETNAFVLRVHVKDDDERRLPPPPPLQDVEIKRLIEAMTLATPKEEKKPKRRIPWFLIVLVAILCVVIYKTFYKPAPPVLIAPAPVQARVTA